MVTYLPGSSGGNKSAVRLIFIYYGNKQANVEGFTECLRNLVLRLGLKKSFRMDRYLQLCPHPHPQVSTVIAANNNCKLTAFLVMMHTIRD